MLLAALYVIAMLALAVAIGTRLRQRRLAHEQLFALRKRHIAMLAGTRPDGRTINTTQSRSA